MTKSWTKLPPEILEIIFTVNGIDRQELFLYELVCQNWKSTAQRLAYAELEFYKLREYKLSDVNDKHCGDDLNTRLKRWISSLQVSDQGPWIHVKKLNSGVIWDEFIEPEDQRATYLDRFAELFPSLEHLEIRNPNATFYLELTRLHRDGKWHNMKTIAEPSDNQSIPAYVDCALEFSDSLTHLELADKIVSFGAQPGNDILHTNQFDLLVKKIHGFTQLNSLKICKYNYRAGNLDVESFDSIIDNCKTLTSVKYKVYNPKSGTSTVDDGNSTTIDISSVRERPHISKVGISAMTLSDQTLQYIMQKYPKLNSLSIIYTINDVCQYSTTILGRFFSFLCNIKDLQLASMTLNTQTFEEAFAHHIETTAAATTSSASRMDYNFRMYFGSDRIISAGAQQDNNVKIAMRTNARDTIFMDLKYKKKQISQFVDTIRRCGQYMDHLFLDFDHIALITTSEEDEYNNNMENGYLLDHVLKHCTKLYKLYLNMYSLDRCNSDVRINNSITRLDLDGCRIADDVLAQISIRLPSLKDLNIERCEFAHLPNFIRIDMKQTRFDSLSIALWRIQNNIGVVHVKEQASEEEGGAVNDKYFKSVHDSASYDPDTSFMALVESDINEYRALVRSGDCLNVIVECRSLRELDLYLHPE